MQGSGARVSAAGGREREGDARAALGTGDLEATVQRRQQRSGDLVGERAAAQLGRFGRFFGASFVLDEKGDALSGRFREDAHAAEVIVVDLDRAQVRESLSPRRRMRELMRLYRSLHKRNLLDTLEPRGLAAFYSAYVNGNRTLHADMQRHLAYERLRVAAHSLFYT